MKVYKFVNFGLFDAGSFKSYNLNNGQRSAAVKGFVTGGPSGAVTNVLKESARQDGNQSTSTPPSNNGQNMFQKAWNKMTFKNEPSFQAQKEQEARANRYTPANNMNNRSNTTLS